MYLFLPCPQVTTFGHTESRMLAESSQHLVPVPRGKTLGEISEALLAGLKRAEATRRGRDGRSVADLMIEERKALPVPKFVNSQIDAVSQVVPRSRFLRYSINSCNVVSAPSLQQPDRRIVRK